MNTQGIANPRSDRYDGNDSPSQRYGFVLTSIVAGLSFCTDFAVAQPPGQAVPVVAATVTREHVAAGQVFVGTVLPSRVVTVGSAVAGRVVELQVNDGDRVEAKQPLAQLLTETIELELKAAQAELQLRREERAELTNGTRKDELQQVQARMLRAESQLKYLELRRKRIDVLFSRNNATTEETRDEAVAAAEAARQSLAEAAAAYQMAVDGPRTELIAQAQAHCAMQEAVVEKLQDQIRKYTVITRFTGYVTQKHTEAGDWLQVGDPVVDVAALDDVEVQAYVAEQHVPFVTRGMSVRVEIPALANRLFVGTVSRIVPQADMQARTFPVKIVVSNQHTDDGPLLKSGMSARATLPTGPQRDALLVPKDALVMGGPQPVVFVVDPPGAGNASSSVRPVPVRLDGAYGNRICVDGPLTPGDSVVVRGNERLRPAQAVTVTSMLSDDRTRPSSESPTAPGVPTAAAETAAESADVAR